MFDYKTCCEVFDITDISFLPAAIMNIVLLTDERRNKVYRRLLEINDYDVSTDWFQSVYEAELSEGKRKGQHFTPPEVNTLLVSLTGSPGDLSRVHEPTAGDGGLIIADWWNRCSRVLPWQWFPSQHTYTAWELSDRSLPILLLNLSIRGIMGVVYHGDVLEQSIKAKYILINRTDDAFGFSDVILDKNLSLKIKLNNETPRSIS